MTAEQRYYTSVLGRFMTPDPYKASAKGNDPTRPQSWNRYVYVGGDPMNFNDPRGLTTCDANGNNCYDSVTVNGDTGDVTWSDFPLWVQITNGIAQLQYQVTASIPQCLFGETLMANGTCDVQLNSYALALIQEMNQMNPGGFINAFVASEIGGVATAIAAGATATALADASWAVVASGNRIVLGSIGEYLELGDALGAQVFNIPASVWGAMTAAEQWAANLAFLQAGIANGASFILATNLNDMQEGTFFWKEVQYVLSQGYTISADGTMLLPPTP